MKTALQIISYLFIGGILFSSAIALLINRYESVYTDIDGTDCETEIELDEHENWK